jgi:UDP-N-acetylglucosamine acyltransferase
MTNVHPTAVLQGQVELAEDVTIGPYVVIQGPAQVGRGTVIDAHCRLEGPIRVGSGNHVFPFCSLGSAPQDISYKGEPTELVIGDENTIREFATFNRATVKGEGLTRVGSRCLFMAYSHIAHDCTVEDHVVFANGATLGGHVSIGYRSTVGAFTGVHQFCRIGPYAFVGGYSVITRDAMPFVKTVGERNSAGIYGINSIGLRRLGFDEERIETLQRAYRLLFRQTTNLGQGLANLKEHLPIEGDVKILVDFIESSKRGVIR